MPTFGETIRQSREGRFSQKELGNQIGVWDTYIGQIEKGEKIPSDEICMGLARALELDETALLLTAYRERASGQARDLFDRMERILSDPVIDRVLSQKELVDLELLDVLKDETLREALRSPVWRNVFLRSYQMKDRNIPNLIESVERMTDRQWEALLNMAVGGVAEHDGSTGSRRVAAQEISAGTANKVGGHSGIWSSRKSVRGRILRKRWCHEDGPSGASGLSNPYQFRKLCRVPPEQRLRAPQRVCEGDLYAPRRYGRDHIGGRGDDGARIPAHLADRSASAGGGVTPHQRPPGKRDLHLGSEGKSLSRCARQAVCPDLSPERPLTFSPESQWTHGRSERISTGVGLRELCAFARESLNIKLLLEEYL